MSDELPTLPRFANLLQAAEHSADTMAQKSELPALVMRGQWRFQQAPIDVWIEQQSAAAAAADERTDGQD
jgi:hypothetical protein